MKRTTTPFVIVALLFGLCLSVGAAYAAQKPNILVIMGDDVGITNISAYSHGLMGYQTPNIDRIAKEGAMFTWHNTTRTHTFTHLRPKYAAMVRWPGVVKQDTVTNDIFSHLELKKPGKR
jgi:hypothetical protein